MEIHEYPEAIANQQALILAIDKQIRIAKESMLVKKLGFKEAIAFDSTLKNDTQRATRLDLMLLTDEDFSEINRICNSLSDHKSQLEIQLEFLVGGFTIAKLLLREKIAHIESLKDF